MRTGTAVLFLALCWIGIAGSASALAVFLYREARFAVRCWRVRREMRDPKGSMHTVMGLLRR